MSRLTIIQDGKTQTHAFDAPLLLSDALCAFGYAVSHPCGGRGTCKKCTVLLGGKPVLVDGVLDEALLRTAGKAVPVE